MCTYIYTYYLSPHCLGCARNDVDIFIDDVTNKAHKNNNFIFVSKYFSMPANWRDSNKAKQILQYTLNKY